MPEYKIALDDVLANVYSAPLSAVDFENWLTFVEHEHGSVQNLYVHGSPKVYTVSPNASFRYFLLWLQSYTRQYNIWKEQALQDARRTRAPLGLTVTSTDPSSASTSASGPPMSRVRTNVLPSKALAYHWHQARRTFLPTLDLLPLNPSDRICHESPPYVSVNPLYDAHLALRVDPTLFNPLIVGESTETSLNGDGALLRMLYDQYPNPKSFAILRGEIEGRLRESVRKFIRASCRNSSLVYSFASISQELTEVFPRHRRRVAAFYLLLALLFALQISILHAIATTRAPAELLVLTYVLFQLTFPAVFATYHGVSPFIPSLNSPLRIQKLTSQCLGIAIDW